jgi:hypothetical protein
MNADGTHVLNGRATIDDDGDFGLVLNKSILSWILKLYSLCFLLVVILLHKECILFSRWKKYTRKTIG